MRNTWMQASLVAATVLLLAGTGCSNRIDNPYAFTGYTLVVRLDADETVAGTAVGYTALLVDKDDDAVEGLEWTVASDLEEHLVFTSATLVPRVAGEHTITVSTEYDGYDFAEDLPLLVDADAPYDLDLRLSDVSMEAGGEITWDVVLVDSWGNDLDGSGAVVTAESPDVEQSGHALTSTLPGMYLVTAEWDGLEDVEPFVVVPGPPAGVALSLSDTDLELLQTASATVDVWDAYGNPTDDPWTIWTDRPTAAVVSFRNVTFLAEGWHTVHVTVDGTSLTDSVGPFLIDSTAPKLTLTTPGRGSWRTSTSTTVAGTVTDDWTTVTDVTINGTPVVPDSSGAFSKSEPLYWGTNLIETVAWDLDGNVADDTRSVLRGSFRGYGLDVPGAIEVRIQEGDGGIEALEAIGEGLVNSYDLDDLIPDPIGHWKSETYVNPCIFWDCGFWVTWYEAKLRLLYPSISGTNLNIDPRSSAELKLDFSVSNPRINWYATNLTALEIDFPNQSGTITASNIWVQIWSTPYVNASNAIKVPIDPLDVFVGVSNLQFDWSGNILWDILEFFGIDDWIEGLVEDYMEGAIKNAVVDEVPPAIEDALQDLELDYSFPLEGRTYDLAARPDGISVNSYGITLSLESDVTVDQSVHPGWLGYGSLWADFSSPYYYSNGKDMQVSFSGDLVNQLLYATWRGGLLDIQETSDALGLPAEDLALLLPGVSSVTVVATPLLPPVVVPDTTTSAEFELQIGDMRLTLYDGPPANNDVLIDAYVTAYVGLDLGASGDTALTASIREPEIYFDVVVPEGNTQAATDTEALLTALVPLILPMLTDALGEIEIPDIAGFGISGISVSTTGAESGYLTLGGSLYQQ